MPLNLQTNDGDFTPFIKYNAKAGRWYIREDGKDGDQEVVNPVLAFDFANIKTGWIFYPPAGSGSGPEKVWDPSSTTMAAKPQGPRSFKRGFEVTVYGDPRSNAGRNVGVREFSSTAGAMIGPVLSMHAEYEKGAAANPGKVPIFACTGVNPVTGIHGTNYTPVFRLSGWMDRRTIPFDADAPRIQPPNGHIEQWPLAEALVKLAEVNISKDQLREALKSRGQTGYNAERDTPLVKEMIAMAKAPAHDEQMDEQPPAPYEDIPF